jgi:hypothetical protein
MTLAVEYWWPLENKVIGCLLRPSFYEVQRIKSCNEYSSSFSAPCGRRSSHACRLNQEVESDLQRLGVFHDPNLVVVQSVTKSSMRRAVEHLMRLGLVKFLVSEP